MVKIQRVKRSLGVHSGTFHADDVCATSLLLLLDLVDRDKIYRTRDANLLESLEYVCDVGGVYDSSIKRFDHHQNSYKGVFSSAGMLLLYLKNEGVMHEDFYGYLHRSIIHGVDEVDNGLCMPKLGHCSFSNVITYFVPVTYDASDVELFTSFMEAVDFTLDLLKRMQAKFEVLQKYKQKVSLVMQQMDNCLVFDEPVLWLEPFFELGGEKHKAKFVIMPTPQGLYKLRGVPPSLEKRMLVRCPFPESWAGLLDEELQEVTGIDGAVFCHKGRFISIWKTKNDALAALKLVWEMDENTI